MPQYDEHDCWPVKELISLLPGEAIKAGLGILAVIPF
jgi:hypothetical protein